MKNVLVRVKAVLLCAFLLFVLPVLSFAGGSTCSTATAVIPDGRSLELDYVAPSSTVWYQFNATANRSYSVEVRDDLDADNADFTLANNGNILFYAPPSTCASPVSNMNYTDTHLTEPAAGPHATRFSFVSAATGAYYVSVQNGSSSIGHYVTVTVAETTIYNTGWSTYANLTAYFQLQNTTSQCISYTLTLIPAAGSTQNTTTSGTIGTSCTSSPAMMVTRSTSSGDLNLTSQAGAAVLTHNGPPGSIQASAMSANFASPATIVPLVIGPMRGK